LKADSRSARFDGWSCAEAGAKGVRGRLVDEGASVACEALFGRFDVPSSVSPLSAYAPLLYPDVVAEDGKPLGCWVLLQQKLEPDEALLQCRQVVIGHATRVQQPCRTRSDTRSTKHNPGRAPWFEECGG
jgi:hypothetical protein